MSGAQFPALVTWGVGIIAVAVALLFVTATRAAAMAARLPPHVGRMRTIRAGLVVTGWMLAFAVAAAIGVLARFDARPPPLLIALAVVLAGTVWCARSAAVARMAAALPLAALVGFQAFRLPLELVMHEAARAGVMPPQMTFTGWNFDILTGISAALLAPAVATGRAPRALVAAWNWMGLLLVLWVLGIGIASTPAIRAFGDDAQNTWIAYFPFVWLPAVLVPAAIMGHVLVFRHVAADARTRAVAAGRKPAPR